MLRSRASHTKITSNGASYTFNAATPHLPILPRFFFGSLHLHVDSPLHSAEPPADARSRLTSGRTSDNISGRYLLGPPLMAPALGSPSLGQNAQQLYTPGGALFGLDSSQPLTPLSSAPTPYIEHIQVSYHLASRQGAGCKKLLMTLKRFKKRSSVDLTTLSGGTSSPSMLASLSSCAHTHRPAERWTPLLTILCPFSSQIVPATLLCAFPIRQGLVCQSGRLLQHRSSPTFSALMNSQNARYAKSIIDRTKTRLSFPTPQKLGVQSLHLALSPS